MSTPFSLCFNSTYIRSVNASDIISQLSFTSSDPVYIAKGGFKTLFGLTADGFGNMYAADANACVIYKISPTYVVTRIAGTGTYGSSGYPGPALSCEFSYPVSLACDAAGNVYVADNETYVISCINTQATTQIICGISIPAGNIAIVAGTLNVGGGSSGDGGAATSAVIEANGQIAVAHGSGNLYLTDADYGLCIRKVTASTGIITNFAGNGNQGYSGDNGAAGSCELAQPNGVAVDANENVYIADTLNSRIRAVNTQGTTQSLFGVSIPSGYINTIAGTGTAGDTGDGGLATSAKVSTPFFISFDVSGNLFISDSGNYKIRVVSPSTFDINTLAGTGIEGNTGNGGLATSAKLGTLATSAAFFPPALTVSPSSVNFVNQVWGFSPATGDGQGNDGTINPQGLSITASGSWTVTSQTGMTWVNQTSGSGNANIVVGISVDFVFPKTLNYTVNRIRTGTYTDVLTITSGGSSTTVAITAQFGYGDLLDAFPNISHGMVIQPTS